jgi:ribosome-binding protein aMBF1 (putative translation factor)
MILKVRGLIVVPYGSIIPMDEKYEADIQKRFGERVRDLRKRRGLSQEALAHTFTDFVTGISTLPA